MPKHPNPFSQPDNWQVIFEQDKSYNSLKSSLFKKSFKQFQINKLNIKPTFNLSQFMTYNFSHFTKFSFAGIAIFTILAGGLSAQALAPDTLKPTQIAQSIKGKYFSANKQSDGDPQVALVPDENNDVASLDECGLSIKYPKEFKQKFELEASTSQNRSVYYFHPVNNTNAFMMIKCVNQNAGSDYYNEIDAIPEDIRAETKISNVSNITLAKDTGWFISQSKNISTKKIQNSILDGYFVTKTDSKEKFSIVIFDNQMVRFNDFQIQFNNGVNNLQNKSLYNVKSECIENAKLNNFNVVATKKDGLINIVSAYANDIKVNDTFYSRIELSCSGDKAIIANLILNSKLSQISSSSNIEMLDRNFINTVDKDSIRLYNSAKLQTNYITFNTKNNKDFYLLTIIK